MLLGDAQDFSAMLQQRTSANNSGVAQAGQVSANWPAAVKKAD
jgi:hypothetical protein